MASLDLVNLGFYTEAFVSAFALLDDLTQEVVKAGMAQKGLEAKDQKELLRAIREERLKHYMTSLMRLCGWEGLDEAKPALFRKLQKANTLRNSIMHGDVWLSRLETITSINTLLETIDWLRSNSFSFVIPPFPLLNLAEAEFSELPLRSAAPPDDTPSGEENRSN
jgi:hypothetical protein